MCPILIVYFFLYILYNQLPVVLFIVSRNSLFDIHFYIHFQTTHNILKFLTSLILYLKNSHECFLLFLRVLVQICLRGICNYNFFSIFRHILCSYEFRFYFYILYIYFFYLRLFSLSSHICQSMLININLAVLC